MRDPARKKKLLELIERIWDVPIFSDMRLMQLLLNSCGDVELLYQLEDDELVKRLTELYGPTVAAREEKADAEA